MAIGHCGFESPTRTCPTPPTTIPLQCQANSGSARTVVSTVNINASCNPFRVSTISVLCSPPVKTHVRATTAAVQGYRFQRLFCSTNMRLGRVPFSPPLVLSSSMDQAWALASPFVHSGLRVFRAGFLSDVQSQALYDLPEFQTVSRTIRRNPFSGNGHAPTAVIRD